MVKGARKRKIGGGCALDPNNIDEDIKHFEGTFGGQPTGVPLSQAEAAAISVPTAPELTVSSLINHESVYATIRKLPRGKAWGADDIPAEFLQAGVDILVPIITTFLSLVYAAEKIPTVWRAALVVPVWKKKGRKDDIAMHRPISLTSTGRRLYERLLIPDIDRFSHYLADSQGGFRPRRGCPHQALALHEALIAAKGHNPRVAFLDLRAAYDLADRGRLWAVVATRYGFPPATVRRFADLFDHNFSQLLVNGKKSRRLHNARGVLQGSSLSPALFNFLINDLALELEAAPGGLKVNGRLIRALLFADDTALLAANDFQLAALLDICDKWSARTGMEFSPSKCLVFAPPPTQRHTPLTLLDVKTQQPVDLPSVTEATYLGFPFIPTGIDFGRLCRDRCAAARKVTASLKAIGMNMTGWAPAASARIYTAFVRPTMEYGVELLIPTPSLMTHYARTQTFALRTILSAPPHTSVDVLHKLLGIQPFEDRARELNFLSTARFCGSNDPSIVGVDIFRRVNNTAWPAPGRGSLPRAALLNPLAIEFRPILLEGLARPYNRDQPAGPKPPPPITRNDRKERRVAALQKLGFVKNGTRLSGVAAATRVRGDGKLHEFMMASTLVSREDRVTITRWQLGTVASHQICRKCGASLTRIHAVECAEVETILGELAAGMDGGVGETIRDTWEDKTLVDRIINGTIEDMPIGISKLLVEAIVKIEEVCRGRERTEMGFFVTPEGVG
jgi:hypothetical protein